MFWYERYDGQFLSSCPKVEGDNLRKPNTLIFKHNLLLYLHIYIFVLRSFSKVAAWIFKRTHIFSDIPDLKTLFTKIII